MADQLKLVLRKSCKQVRDNLTPNYQQAASAKISDQIRALQEYRQAKYIALYQANQGEVNLNLLWYSAPLQGKFCYFPAMNRDKTLSFLPATPHTAFSKNRYGIAEPEVSPAEALSPDSFHIIFLPLVAFDLYGTRLGMGGGFYDRTLVGVKNPLLIGVAYEFQRQPYIKPDSWDIPLHAVVTQETIYWSKKCRNIG